MGRLHHDHRVVVVAADRLHEQRHVVHHDPALGRGRDPAQELLADRRVRDRLELLAGLVGHERPLGERGAVERAVGQQDLGPERLDQRGRAPAARLDHLARDRVGVDHHRAPLDEHPRDGRLPRPDPAREPDHQHGGESTGGPQDTLPHADIAA